MPDNNRRLLPTCRSVVAAIGLALAALFTGTPNVASAHSFVVTLDATAAAEPLNLASAIQGMRVAASERDSHAAETSDGHLGGIDLFIRVQPVDAAEGITWLKGAPTTAATVIVDFSGPDVAPSRIAADGTLVITPGKLPPAEIWSGNALSSPNSFAARYHAAYDGAPDRQAAQGYNAALRIDRAVRDSGGLHDIEALRKTLDRSTDGIDWP
ncbi:hypothetical protein SAMN04488523_1085 [Sulfitobacter brevis]|uniref:Uncharacterized protein n=1 Tax=Sulfitobacter brevis TaxID=74348 RepID=A0A1I2B957_9RHOB|nr:hypothetical protein [Sulfitobacter brevis]SFE51680.1 hypothetical protein SAMN04488523_1085 [Sulfitobacter brevis]